MPKAALLTPAMLDRLVEHPAARGAPILSALAPGLTDAAIDDLTGPLPLRFPEELRVLWRWRNGPARPEVWRLGGFNLISLPDAVSQYHQQRALEVELDDFGPDELFPERFFPFAMSLSDITAADCSHPERALAPVHHVPSHDVATKYLAEPEVASLGEWAAWQLKALDDRLYWWDADSRAWATRSRSSAGDGDRPVGPAFIDGYSGWR